jgi:bacterial/archaeal transporter family-2 protein
MHTVRPHAGGAHQDEGSAVFVTTAAAGLAVLAGLAGSVQVAVMGRFGGRIGVVEALAFATGVQLLLAAAVLVAARQGLGNLGGAFRAPAWMWVGGLMGLLVVFSITFAQPRLGATTTIGILIAGQLAMGAVIDRLGLFGVAQIGLSWPRLLGIVLLGAGAALSLAR